MAPSQSGWAVAGVQLLLRQHSSFVPLRQASEPSPLVQLSTVWAPAAEARLTVAASSSMRGRLRLFMRGSFSRSSVERGWKDSGGSVLFPAE